MRDHHEATLLGRHRVAYFECTGCGFLRTEDPYWLAEAYSSAISALDTGAVARNIDCARDLSRLIPMLFGRDGHFLDFAGGHGVMTRLMRDYGLDYYWSDEYAVNHYAQGFDWGPSLVPAVAVTAVEVLEHVTDPVSLVAEVLEVSSTENVLFTTLLRPRRFDSDWWYLATDSGQHVGFHTRESLRALASRVGLTYQGIGRWHLLTATPLSAPRVAAAIVAMAPGVVPRLARARRSLAQPDHTRISRDLQAGTSRELR